MVDDTGEGIVLGAEKGGDDEYAICAKEVYSLNEVAAMFGGAVTHLPATKSTRSSGAMDTAKLEALGWRQAKTLRRYIEESK